MENCKICKTPGCIESRGVNFHEGNSFESLKCDYKGTPPFPLDEICIWCSGTGHPYGDESYLMCKCND